VNGAVPAAATLNVAAPGAITVWLTGAVVSVGITCTVSVAGAVVTDPFTFVTVTANNSPSSLPLVGGVVYELPVAPTIGTPFFVH
jgi:hypothetical protein